MVPKRGLARWVPFSHLIQKIENAACFINSHFLHVSRANSQLVTIWTPNKMLTEGESGKAASLSDLVATVWDECKHGSWLGDLPENSVSRV